MGVDDRVDRTVGDDLAVVDQDRAGADVASKNGGRYMLYTGFDNMNVPSNGTLPTNSGSTSGVMTLSLATRDAQ